MDSHAIGLFMLHTLDIDDIFLSVHLDYLGNLLTFIVSSNHLDLVVLEDGMGWMLYFCCNSLEGREDTVFCTRAREH
jgi:hypothetical protein